MKSFEIIHIRLYLIPNPMKWKLLVTLAVVCIVVAYGVVFTPGVIKPKLLSLPYVLWTGIFLTGVLVLLTYLGARYFPHHDD